MILSRSRLLAAASACVVVTTLAACNASESPDAAPEPGAGTSGGATPGETEPSEPAVPPVR